jgi:hypothetical protein
MYRNYDRASSKFGNPANSFTLLVLPRADR